MKLLARILVLIAALCAIGPAAAQVQFPTTLPSNTVWGRTGISAGPGQAIPFNILTGNLLLGINGGVTCIVTGLCTLHNAATGVLNIVTDFGADPTGVVAMDTAFNNAMAACAGGFNQFPQKGTVYIPAGTFTVSSGLTWKQNCNIVADHAAYIKVTSSISALLAGGVGSGNTLEFGFLYGGQWDCNNNTVDGFRIPDFEELRLSHFQMFNCSSGSGGFIHLGNVSAAQQFSAYVDFFSLYNFGTKNAGNSGIFTDVANTAGIHDNAFNNGVIEGTDIAINMVGQGCSDCVFNQIHAYIFGTQGSMSNGMVFNGFGPVNVSNSQIDTPIVSNGACYVFNTTLNIAPNRIEGSGCFEATNDNIVNAVSVGSGQSLIAVNNSFRGNSGANRIKTDFVSSDFTNVWAMGNNYLNVVTLNQNPAVSYKTSGFDPVKNVQISASVASNNLTVSLLNTNGTQATLNSPITASFRNATLTGGGLNPTFAFGAISFTVNSGNTLGTANSVPFRLWVVLFQDSQVGLINCVTGGASPTGIFPLQEDGVASSTSGNGGNNAATFYTSSTETSNSYRIIGYMEWSSGLATAGTWASGPTRIALFGPGIKKPGDIVQTQYASTTTQFQTTSASLTSTGFSASITPTSAANLVQGTMTFVEATNTAASALEVVLERSSSIKGNSVWANPPTANGFFSPTPVEFLEAPGSTSSLSYGAFISSNGTAQGTFCPTSSGICQIKLQEIMGALEPANDNELLRKVG